MTFALIHTIHTRGSIFKIQLTFIQLYLEVISSHKTP